jgi:predicted enzyme related to lactoylglutathione lyase
VQPFGHTLQTKRVGTEGGIVVDDAQEATPPADDESPVFRDAGVSYLRIPTDDPRRAAEFYAAVFGWRVDADRREPSFEDGTGHVIGHFVAAAADVAGAAGIRPYVYVDSVDAVLERVAWHGGAGVEAPYAEGNLWVATFRDPAGNVVGVWQRAPRDRTASGTEG